MKSSITLYFPFSHGTQEVKIETDSDIEKDIIDNKIKMNYVHPVTGLEKNYTVELERYLKSDNGISAVITKRSTAELEAFLEGDGLETTF